MNRIPALIAFALSLALCLAVSGCGLHNLR